MALEGRFFVYLSIELWYAKFYYFTVFLVNDVRFFLKEIPTTLCGVNCKNNGRYYKATNNKDANRQIIYRVVLHNNACIFLVQIKMKRKITLNISINQE